MDSGGDLSQEGMPGEAAHGDLAGEASLAALIGHLRLRLQEAYGSAGKAWAESLPETCARALTDYRLRMVRASTTEFSLVMFCSETGSSSSSGKVLKFCMPAACPQAFDWELWRAFGSRVVAPTTIDEHRDLIVFEQILPGNPLSELARIDDQAATRVMATVLARFLTAEEVRLPTSAVDLESWCAPLFSFAKQSLPSEEMNRHIGGAQDVLMNLAATSSRAVLLHGDLHHENVLKAGRDTWKVIDPKGVLAEPAFEVGALMRNPGPELSARLDVAAVLRTRLRILHSALGFPQRRMAEWAYAQAALSYLWALEDGDEGWATHASRLLDPLRCVLMSCPS